MLWDKMSLINKKLKKTKFHPRTLFPTNLREGDLIFENGKSFAVVGVLRPGEDKINFFRDQNYNKSVEKLFSTIKENKNEYILFKFHIHKSIVQENIKNKNIKYLVKWLHEPIFS